MNKTFKILMHYNMYVDIHLLEKGIYTTNVPQLYSKDETIESLIEKIDFIDNLSNNQFLSETYIENLKKCNLVDVTLSFNL